MGKVFFLSFARKAMTMKKLMLALVCGTFAAVAFGKTIYVSPEGAGNKDGSSPENAYAARDCIGKGKTVVSNGDTVKLLEGTYHESGTEWYAVESRMGVIIEGDVVNPANVVFDGQGGNVRFFGVQKPGGGTRAEATIRGVTFKNTNSGGNYQSIYVNDSTAYIEDCVFSGITNTGGNGAAIWFSNYNSTGEVRRCSFTDCAGPNNSGGAIARNNTSDYYTLHDCAFTNCTAKNAGGAQGVSIVERCEFVNCAVKDSNGGGAIWDNIADAEIRGCDFIGCSSNNKQGGALYLTASATLTGCTFSNCSAPNSSNAGAIFTGSDLTMIDCDLDDSSAATHAGAVYQSATKTTRFSGCTFSRNVAQYGGAVGINGSGLTEFIDCTFADNTNVGSSYGAAICLNAAGTLNIKGCRFSGNTTTGSGLIAFRNGDPASVTIEDSFFVGNEASRGACVMCERQPAKFMMRNCLCVSNVVSTSNGGMCLELKATAGRVENCTFADNKSLVATGNMWHAPLEFNGGTVSAANCIFMNNLDSEGTHYATWVRAGTLTIDYSAHDLTSENSKSADYKRMTAAEHNVPLTASPFKDAANGDYTLPKKVDGEPNPCLGAGVKLDWMTKDSKDLAGNPRLRGDDIVDLGCYEYFQKSGLYLILR